jgi:hypothetical protein
MTKQFGGIILQYVVRSCVENARQSQQLDRRQGTKSLPWSLEHGPVRAQVSAETRRGGAARYSKMLPETWPY